MTVFVTRASNYEKIVEKVGHEPEKYMFCK
jgi:hypothetical protein